MISVEDAKACYIKYQSYYRQLQEEVFIFLNKIKEDKSGQIDIESVSQRPNNQIKLLSSIIKNIEERPDKYSQVKDFTDINDIAGVRITCYCQSDRDTLFDILDGELRQEYKDVVGDKKEDGAYRACHYNFSKSFSIDGADIKLCCEVQLRTVLGNAWAVQDTKYVYKKGQGDNEVLSTAISNILNSCENLWDLVKSKVSDEEGNVFARTLISEGIKSDVSAIPARRVIIKDGLDIWLRVNKAKAWNQLTEMGIKGSMEVEAYLPNSPIEFGANQLNDSAQKSTISTFGWPIGVYLANREEYRPRPTSDGIQAEVSIKEPDWVDNKKERVTYDYWAIKKDGSFYLLKSIFEDMRKPDKLFFDTRIIRITETLMYLSNLYNNLGLDKNELINIKITHSGLKGRTIGAAGNRLIFEDRKTNEDESSMSVQVSLEEIDNDMTNIVSKFTTPLFEIFDFFLIGDNILDDIVTKYRNGIIS